MDTNYRVISPDDVALLLEEAKELIEKKGWTRGEYQRGTRYCVIGAVRAARFNLSLPGYVEAAAEQELDDSIRDPDFENVLMWNDAQKSKKPVVDLLARVSKKLRNPEVTT